MSIATESSAMQKSQAMYWNIDAIVADLRTLRTTAAGRQPGMRPPKLPSQKALVNILDGLSAALFPNRLGLPELTDEGVDYYVGNTLDTTLRQLLEQVRRELQFSIGHATDDNTIRDQALAITREFAGRLPEVRRLLEGDIRAAYQGDPAARSVDEVLVCYPGITAVTHHRLAHVLYGLGAPC